MDGFKDFVTKKKYLVIFFVVLFLTSIFLLVKGRDFQQYSITATPFGMDDFVYAKGDDIYAYNGLAFYRTDAKTHVTNVLNTGKKLPFPKQLYWADNNGVLVTFDYSFYGSIVENKVSPAGGLIDSDVKDDLWFYSFSNSTLNKVDSEGPLPNLVFYASSQQGFYFVTKVSGVNQLVFYNVNTGEKELVADNLPSQVTKVTPCAVSEIGICLIYRDSESGDMFLAKVKESSQLETVESASRLFFTNSDRYFAEIRSRGDEDGLEGGEADEGAVYLYDAANNSRKAVGYESASTNLVTFVNAEENTVLIYDNSLANGGGVQYFSGDINQKSVPSKKYKFMSSGKPYDRFLLDQPVSGGDFLLLPNDLRQFVYIQNNSKENAFSIPSSQLAQEIVGGCKQFGVKNFTYVQTEGLFKIYFLQNDDFAANIAKFSDCMVQKNLDVLMGFRYYFGGIDPINGRISTD